MILYYDNIYLISLISVNNLSAHGFALVFLLYTLLVHIYDFKFFKNVLKLFSNSLL